MTHKKKQQRYSKKVTGSEEAIAAYQRTIPLKPDYAEAHFNLGFTLSHVSRVEEARPRTGAPSEQKP
ncbi:MAG TPA: tetratricopeptide repeat protein [Xanthobacteraceae bacterium]|nr:tetratricopeptide repeat protein [Xanthobacteraceae bacterium]